MSKFSKQILNPMDFICLFWPEANVDHISYDEKFNPGDRDYWVIRQAAHDGTLLFTQQLIARTLVEVVQMTSCYTLGIPENLDDVKEIRYVLGPIKLSAVFGVVDLPVGRFPGQRERTRMAVKSTVIYE